MENWGIFLAWSRSNRKCPDISLQKLRPKRFWSFGLKPTDYFKKQTTHTSVFVLPLIQCDYKRSRHLSCKRYCQWRLKEKDYSLSHPSLQKILIYIIIEFFLFSLAIKIFKCLLLTFFWTVQMHFDVVWHTPACSSRATCALFAGGLMGQLIAVTSSFGCVLRNLFPAVSLFWYLTKAVLKLYFFIKLRDSWLGQYW